MTTGVRAEAWAIGIRVAAGGTTVPGGSGATTSRVESPVVLETVELLQSIVALRLVAMPAPVAMSSVGPSNPVEPMK